MPGETLRFQPACRGGDFQLPRAAFRFVFFFVNIKILLFMNGALKAVKSMPGERRLQFLKTNRNFNKVHKKRKAHQEKSRPGVPVLSFDEPADLCQLPLTDAADSSEIIHTFKPAVLFPVLYNTGCEIGTNARDIFQIFG
jgi:hypothetical protein